MAFTVRDFHDLIELLEKEPAWRADIRRLVLSEEILSLPQVMWDLAQNVEKLSGSVDARFNQVDTKIQDLSESVDARFNQVDTKIQDLSESVDVRFNQVDTKIQDLSESVDVRFNQVDERFNQVDKRFNQVDERFNQVDERFSQVDARFNRVDRDIHALKTDVGDLKGSNLESNVRERPFVYLGRFALRLKAVSDAELAILLEDAVERDLITEEEAEDAKLLDAVARGRRRGAATPLYLAVEVSSVVDQHDLARAVRRAVIVEKASGIPTQPIVVGKQVLDDVRQAAEDSRAGWVTLP